MFMFKRAWYEVQVLVPGVMGHGETYRGAFNGTLRDCRKYADEQSARGIGWRVVRTKVVVERDGAPTSDRLRTLFRGQALADVHEVLAGHFPEVFDAEHDG